MKTYAPSQLAGASSFVPPLAEQPTIAATSGQCARAAGTNPGPTTKYATAFPRRRTRAPALWSRTAMGPGAEPPPVGQPRYETGTRTWMRTARRQTPRGHAANASHTGHLTSGGGAMLATDRCDRCGAQAYTGWWLTRRKGELLFCAHHDRQHEAALEAQGWNRLIDDRAKLTEQVREPEPA